MTSTLTLEQDWIKKYPLDNKENDSNKIEIDEIPTSDTKGKDSYLQSILSTSATTTPTKSNTCIGNASCVCYKCQRQRRRANLNVYTPLNKIEKNPISNQHITENQNSSFSSNQQNPDTTSVATAKTTTTSTSTSTSTNTNTINTADNPPAINTTSITAATETTNSANPIKKMSPSVSSTTTTTKKVSIRKTPTLKSYEKYLPKPSYSQQESIYRFNKNDKKEDNNKKENLNNFIKNEDNYQISWKEDNTGDDLLTSLVTFQTIFEEKNQNENDGLSDLLEQRTKELKYKNQQPTKQIEEQEVLPPKRSDCLTLSYRQGPKHRALTLFHTMKLKNEKERIRAYNMAYQHCINANTGLKLIIKKNRTPPQREESKLIQSVFARKPTLKRSLFGKKNDEFLLWSASTENLQTKTKEISSPIHNEQIIDIISIANNLLPNQQFTDYNQHNKIPYEHIDIPIKPSSIVTTEFKDNSSVSSIESANGTIATSPNSTNSKAKSRTGRLFSSLGRKASMKSYNKKAPSIKSFEKA